VPFRLFQFAIKVSLIDWEVEACLQAIWNAARRAKREIACQQAPTKGRR
jgi:hypothetical protein